MSRTQTDFNAIFSNVIYAKNKMFKIRTQEDFTARRIFNETHTAFDVLVDYAFGGDKQAALEYLKTL